MKDVSDTQPAETPGLNDPLEGVVKWFDPLKGFGFVACRKSRGNSFSNYSVLHSHSKSVAAL